MAWYVFMVANKLIQVIKVTKVTDNQQFVIRIKYAGMQGTFLHFIHFSHRKYIQKK